MSGSGKTTADLADDLSRPSAGQEIYLTGKQGAYTIHGCEVRVHASKTSEGAGSNKVKVSTITNQVWELPKHRGSMVACSKDFLAYILEGKSGYLLRLIEYTTTNRALLKCTGTDVICDVSFMHMYSNMLACVDGCGNLHVWDLDKAKLDITKAQVDALKLIVKHSSTADGEEHRLTWCPYVRQDEDGEEEEPTLILALSHGNDIEAVDLQVLFKQYPSGITVPSERVVEGLVAIPAAHQKAITDLSMSPDGLVLASSSEDGHLKFWQIDWENKTYKCLHDYIPHNGAPVTRLIFCDDHMNHDSSAQFWRFLITAANDSSEVKLWCTVTWKCLQTISFLPPVTDECHPRILLCLDPSAKYLMAADSHRTVLYVLQLLQDGVDGSASFISLTEYPLTQPIISFVVIGNKPLPLEGESGDELDASPVAVTKFDSRRNGVLLNLRCIQTKSMQEMQVRFEPPDIVGIPPAENLALSQNDGNTSPEGNLPPSSTEPSKQQPLLLPSHFPSIPDAIPTPMAVKLFTPSELASSSSSPSLTTFPVSTLLQSSSLPSLTPLGVPSMTTPLHILMPTTFGATPIPAESSSSWLPSGSMTTEDLLKLPPDSDGTGEEEEEAEIMAAHQRVMELFKAPDHTPAGEGEEEEGAKPISYEQFIQALDEKKEDRFPVPKVPKPPRGEGEGQSISGDEETESAGAEVVVSQELSGEEVGGTAPLPLTDEEKEGKGEEEGEEAQWPDLMGGAHVGGALGTPLLVCDEVLVDEFSVMERGGNSSLLEREGKDGSRDESDASQDHEVAEEDVVGVHDEVLNQPGHQSLGAGPSTPHPHQGAGPDTKEVQQELLEVPEAAPVVSKKKTPRKERRRKSKPKNTAHLEAVNGHSDGERASASSEPYDPVPIAELHRMVAKQQEEIKELKELHSHSFASLQLQLNGFSASILEELKTISSDQQQRYDRLNRDGAQEKQKQDKFLNTLSQNVTSTINTKLEKLVKQEMKNAVLPAMLAVVEQKSSVAANVAVQEAVRNALASKELVDVLTGSLSNTIQKTASNSYELAFKHTVLPAFERACQEMFRQVDEAFRAGTTDYLTQLQRQRQQDPALQQLTSAVFGLQAQLSAPTSPLAQALQGLVHQELQPLPQQLQVVLADLMRRELGVAFEQHTAALGAQLKAEVGLAFERHASTMNTQLKVQEERKKREEEIKQLLAAKQLNKAFEVALSTSDLSVVMFLCQLVVPDEVFSSADCPLTQPVLLSLIQQLSVNLSDNLDLKIGYLEGSILALDPKSDTARSHMSPVLTGLTQGLASVERSIQGVPESVGLSKQVRRLRMIAERLCHPLGR